MTALEWLAFIVLLIVGVTAGLAVTLSNGAVTRAIRQLERTYRRQKSLELEKLEEELVARRMQEVEAELTRPDGWRKVLNQVLADALVLSEAKGRCPEPVEGPEVRAAVGQAGVLDLSAEPAPRFTVAGEDGRTYLFTASPDALRRVGLLSRRENVVPLDASLHPAARVEVQAVWEHLAEQRLQEQPVLPRQAAWFLVVMEPRQQTLTQKPG